MTKDRYDFGGDEAQTYKQKCSNCNKEILISSQKNEYPEYIVPIYVKCSCGNSVKFEIKI